MLHTNVAELRLLVDTFTRVWSSGGQANLSLETNDCQMWAKLDLQLGPAASRRPGLPEAGGRAGAKPWNHTEHPPHHHPQPRRRGPGARARDERRRQDWLAKRQEVALEQPDSRVVQEQSQPLPRLEQEDQEILVTTAVANIETELDIVTSDTNSESIPQLDGPSETADTEQVVVKNEEEPVLFKIQENGYAETREIAPDEAPPARVYHPELGVGSEPRRTKWRDKVFIEYIFEDNVQMEMYVVI